MALCCLGGSATLQAMPEETKGSLNFCKLWDTWPTMGILAEQQYLKELVIPLLQDSELPD